MNHYHFTDENDAFEADLPKLKQMLQAEQEQLKNYQDLLVEQDDDDAYIARGNGFCDAKYSAAFLDMQIQHIEQRIAQLKHWIDEASAAK